MLYHGFQFKAARTVTDIKMQDVSAATGLSEVTLCKVERQGELVVSETQRKRGTIEAKTVEALVAFYEKAGVTFLPARGNDGPGIRYTPPPSARAGPSKRGR